MRTTITGRNLEISDGWRAKIEKKVGKLDKYLRDDAEVLVRLSQERGTRNTAEITIPLAGTMIRAEETGPEMTACLDKVLDKIVRQIHRHRTKLEKRLRTEAFDLGAVEPPIEEAEDAHTIVRVKKFSVKPVSVEEAITQMEMLGHNFHLFLNEDTDAACVVYRRMDGDYGLLEMTNA